MVGDVIEVERVDAPAPVPGAEEALRIYNGELGARHLGGVVLGSEDGDAFRAAYRRIMAGRPTLDVATLRGEILQWERDCSYNTPPDDHDFRRLDSILSRHVTDAPARKVERKVERNDVYHAIYGVLGNVIQETWIGDAANAVMKRIEGEKP